MDNGETITVWEIYRDWFCGSLARKEKLFAWTVFFYKNSCPKIRPANSENSQDGLVPHGQLNT